MSGIPHPLLREPQRKPSLPLLLLPRTREWAATVAKDLEVAVAAIVAPQELVAATIATAKTKTTLRT